MSSQAKNRPEDERRDAAIEALLARQSGMNGSSTPCPDAEVLAAYADHSLDETEAARWESHFAGCERCQDVLTALADSAPMEVEEHAFAAAPARAAVAATSVAKPRRRSSMFLLAGIAAAAAVVALIVLRPSSAPNAPSPAGNEAASQNASQPPAQNPAAPPVFDSNRSFSSTPRSAPQAVPNRSVATPSAPAVNLQQAAEEPRIQINPVVTPDVNADGLTPAQTQVPNASSVSGAPAGGVAGAFGGRAANRETKSAAAAPAPAPPSVSAQLQAPQTQTPRSESALKQAYSAGLEGSQLAKTRSGAAANVPSDQAASPFSSVLVFPLNGNVIWRIGADGLVEKSSDSGMTWVRQESGTNTQLVAGSAPNNQICWLVGNGVILRTADGGATWSKVPPPISGAQIDWTAIYATDANSAHVASIDGRRFATKDGGQTWSPVAE